LLKLSYNLVAGLTAIAIYQTAGTETLASAIFFGIMSPLLAMAMAAGGGMSVFNAVLAVSGAAGGLAMSRITSLVSSAGGAAAGAAKQVQSAASEEA